jgi:sirohydrochlorin cobaltochelatase
MHPIPLVIVAFGTTAKALASYEHLSTRIKECFPDHEIYWTYSSRIITDRASSHPQNPSSSPSKILESLYQQHHSWAVVQSLHLIGGHEFVRLVEETKQSPLRTSIGLPLLSAPEDYLALCNSLSPLIHAHPDQAILLIGHGTDHPAWCAYPALQYFMRRQFGPRIFVGMIEQGFPSCTEVIADIAHAGYKNVCIIPLLLVAGMHFHRDLAGDHGNSWMTLLTQEDINVEIIQEGIGILPAISEIFCRHIDEALAIIPDNKEALS